MKFVRFIKAVGQGAMAVTIGLVVLLGIAIMVRPNLSQVVVAASQSPDGTLEAMLIETNGGATTSFGYVVEARRTNGQAAWHEVASLQRGHPQFVRLRGQCALERAAQPKHPIS